jgi:hypothetical protein
MRARPLRRLACSFSLTLAALSAAPRAAEAFCGFYVGGADATLFNNATQVVLMREGTKTVLSMQNNYQGPPANFAMVVPVPVVLQKENVKTLPREVFERVDRLAAPRLVEYWEQDPCAPQTELESKRFSGGPVRNRVLLKSSESAHGVTIEAQFTVGEYEIVILSAKDSLGLDTWLRQEKYKIPDGAEPILRPYVQSGMKFFVAKVDVSKVRFEGGMAMLSPLRFSYDTDSFNLPVRLGLMNSAGTQDLIVHILARGQRYEVANYKNTFIPTNIDVAPSARDKFGSFYAALFDRTLEKNPGAVVTEYSWDASSCDPCPSPALRPDELATLGADVAFGGAAAPPGRPIVPMPRPGGPRAPKPGTPVTPPRFFPSGFVLTRLHARYQKNTLGDDLVFAAAPPIEGGREWLIGDKLEKGSRPGGVNNFQGRYAIRHSWTGPIACASPHRGVWGGNPSGAPPSALGRQAQPALNLAFASRDGIQLAAMVRETVPEIGLDVLLPGAPVEPAPVATPPAPVPTRPGSATVVPADPQAGGCAGCVVGAPSSDTNPSKTGIAALMAALFAYVRAGRRRSRPAACTRR